MNSIISHGRAWLVAIVAAVLLTACSASGSSGPGPTPSGASAAPTATSSSTPAHAPTATALAHQLQDHGLKLRHLVTFTAASDPNHLMGRQGGYTSKVQWSTGGIEVYPDHVGAKIRINYLRSFSGSIVGDGYDFLKGVAILRLDAVLTPTQAARFKAAFGS